MKNIHIRKRDKKYSFTVWTTTTYKRYCSSSEINDFNKHPLTMFYFPGYWTYGALKLLGGACHEYHRFAYYLTIKKISQENATPSDLLTLLVSNSLSRRGFYTFLS